jgi:hypothetical protein
MRSLGDLAGRLAIIAALTVSASACASGGDKRVEEPEVRPREDVDRGDQMRRGLGDAATQPLKDVGLLRPDIPAPLAGIRYPYKTQELLVGCPAVAYEIGQLDAALGREDYRPSARRSTGERGADAASGAVVGAMRDAAGDIIPFRGWVRRASGADKAEREVAQAIEMGQTRRAFLRGYGAALGCSNVLPPAPVDNAVDPATPPPQGRDQRSPRG